MKKALSHTLAILSTLLTLCFCNNRESRELASFSGETGGADTIRGGRQAIVSSRQPARRSKDGAPVRNEPAGVSVPKDSTEWQAALFFGWEYDCRKHNSKTDNICGGDYPTRGSFFNGIIYNTVVKEDSTYVRNGPSYESNILFQVNKYTKIQVLGVSEESSFVDAEHWVKVRVLMEDGSWTKGEHWIYGKFIAYRDGEKIMPVRMNVKKESGRLVGHYEIDSTEMAVKLTGYKEKDSYVFFYCMHNEGAHYRLIPGLYVWRPSSNKLEHVSYLSHFYNK